LDVLQTANRIEPNDSDVVREIGEVLRKRAWEGNEGYEELLKQAIGWFDKGMKLNRWDPYNYAYAGMCYTWLGEKEKASELFEKASAMDYYSYYIRALYGWYRLQEGDLEGAKEHFGKSYGYNGWANGANELARSYLELIEKRLAEKRQDVEDLKK